MHYSYITISCPACHKALAFKFLKIYGFIPVTSGLGPNYLVCSSCGAKMQTNYKEWHQMSLGGKLWYWALSILYGALLGFISSIIIEAVFEKMPAPAISSDLAELITIAAVTFIILVIQTLRIFISIERIEDNTGSEKSVSFWDWETNFQIYGILWFLLTLFGLTLFL